MKNFFSFRELLDKVKSWEESELSAQSHLDKPHLSPKKKLAPLNEAGPVQLLNLQINELEADNATLRERVKGLEASAVSAISGAVG